MPQIIYGPCEVAGALAIMATDILAAHQLPPTFIGIRRGGVTLAQRLATLIQAKTASPPDLGIVDINLYRDDWTRARALPKVGKTEIPFSLDDRRIILVDDVLFTGRTVRAALEALAEFGRPARIELAVLVDRGHREMPLEANYAPFKVKTDFTQRVNVFFQEQDEQTIEDAVVLEN